MKKNRYMTIRQIARELDLTTAAIYLILKKKQLKFDILLGRIAVKETDFNNFKKKYVKSRGLNFN